MSNKVLIDLDHPIWNSEPGFGGESANNMRNEPKCALGKLGVVTGLYPYGFYTEITGKNSERIYTLNDKGITEDSTRSCKPSNHWQAVSLMLEDLAASGKVEFKGTMVSDVLKAKLACQM